MSKYLPICMVHAEIYHCDTFLKAQCYQLLPSKLYYFFLQENEETHSQKKKKHKIGI